MSEIAAYIESLDLPAPRSHRERDAAPPPTFTGGDQGLVIGSQLTEFTTGVPRTIRPAIGNSLLLAQLAADKANPNQASKAWFATFNTVLTKIGWLPVGGMHTTQQISDRDAELHKAIVPVLTAVFGPVATAGSIILSVLQGLQAMNENQPWLTLFERRSRKVKAAQFGMNFIDGGEGGGATLKTVYFSLTATNELTQVLFVRLSEVNATVSSEWREATLSTAAIMAAENALQEKVGPHIVGNIAGIEI